MLLLHVQFQPQTGAGAGYGFVGILGKNHYSLKQIKKLGTTKVTKNTKKILSHNMNSFVVDFSFWNKIAGRCQFNHS
jgi:hypothetical protein